QWARLYYESNYNVQGNYHLIYTAGRPTAVREFNTPADPKNIEHMLGFFIQDAWSVSSRLTLNLGLRYDKNKGILPAQSNPGGPFIAPRSIDESEPINQSIAVWPPGASCDLT